MEFHHDNVVGTRVQDGGFAKIIYISLWVIETDGCTTDALLDPPLEVGTILVDVNEPIIGASTGA